MYNISWMLRPKFCYPIVEETQSKVTEEEKKKVKNYFTIQELTASATATNLHINNTPPENIKSNLIRMIDFLDLLREAWGSPIRVTSGYRCVELNNAVGGSKTSAHLTGNAVDLQPVNGKQKEFENFVINYVKDKNFDQILRETTKSGKKWLHLGLYNNSGLQRKQIKVLTV